MRPSLDAGTLIGFAALVGTLVRGGPGVQITRAEGETPALTSALPPGPTCQASAHRVAAEGAHISALVAEVERQARVEAQANPAAEVPVALNGRGYNYRSGGEDAAAALHRQLQLIRRE